MLHVHEAAATHLPVAQILVSLYSMSTNDITHITTSVCVDCKVSQSASIFTFTTKLSADYILGVLATI
jgi:hypothetical protein